VDPAWNRNRTLRARYALLDGQPEHHPEGVYYLRFLRDGNRVWEAVGSDVDTAVVSLRNTEHDLQAISLGRNALSSAVVSASAVEPDAAISLEEATQAYLEEVRRFRSSKTISACENMLGRFSAGLPGKVIREISRKDLLDHMVALKEEGLGDRTIFNHVCRINTLLKANGVSNLLNAADKPRYDEKDVTAYNSDELASLFAAATPEERILFEFFLGTGFRQQEVMYCTWANVDQKSRVVSVWSKPEMGFRVKDKEDRSVPAPDSLIASLAERKKSSTSILIFPGKSGSPDGHFLGTLQRLAFRTGQAEDSR
jgi:integrase/recombinase XerD